MTARSVDVLVVDDSTVVRALLVQILESDPEIHVIGTADDGRAALDFVGERLPDVILMDLHMPGMDGLEATRRIMETRPIPIVVCTATADANAVATTFSVIEAGALDCLEKPVGRGHPQFDQMAERLRRTVKLMAEVKLVRRWRRPVPAAARPAATRNPVSHRIRFIGMGASTGGPPALREILSSLPSDFPAPILVVQHIAPGFLPGLAEWLAQTTVLQVRIPSQGTWPLPGHVYLAPDDLHMSITHGGDILLTEGDREEGPRPAVSRLFRSLADVCGPGAVGVLLTGMGKDGAAELKQMRDKGAVTIAQDRESSVVHGMPHEAIINGGATHVLAADKIADRLLSTVGHH